MAPRRRRQLRRSVLVFLGSLVAHVGLFFFVIKDFHFYPMHEIPEEAVQVQIVPQPEPIPPPLILPPIKPQVQPTPQPPAPPPTPQPQPTPPKPQPPTPERATPKPVQTPTAPLAATPKPTPNPAPRPAPAPTPSPLAPPTPAPNPGPPKVVSQSQVVKSQAQVAAPAPKIVLHRSKEQGALAPAVAIPGAVFAPPAGPTPQAGAPSGGTPGGGTGLPGGALPGFGGGLRGGVLGCANAEALHLSAAEKARCAQSFGEGARESPQMSAIDAGKREQLDHEAAAATAARKYRDSTPSGSEAHPVGGQPKILQSPAQ